MIITEILLTFNNQSTFS